MKPEPQLTIPAESSNQPLLSRSEVEALMVHEARKERRESPVLSVYLRHGSVERGRSGPEYRGYAAE
jgi:hypothetical protein